MFDLLVSILTLVVLLCAFVFLVSGTLDLLGRIHRYRTYRRSYPASDRGKVWKYVR